MTAFRSCRDWLKFPIFPHETTVRLHSSALTISYFNSFMPHLELPRVTSDSSATTRHWLALCISALCPGKKGFIFPASPPSIYSPGGWAPCCFLFSGQRRGMWAGKLKSHLWHLEARPHPTLTRQKLYFDCVFCSQIPFIFWLCFFIDLWTPGGLGIVFHSQISYYKERSVCQEKPKKWGI